LLLGVSDAIKAENSGGWIGNDGGAQQDQKMAAVAWDSLYDTTP
jgi:hypothetical protein